MDFTRFEAVTFDCYGTLVDWETGIAAALAPILRRRERDDVPTERLLELFARFEAEEEAGPFRPYRHVLIQVCRRIGAELGFTVTGEESAAFAGSVPSWPPFDDAAPSLRTLAERYRLAVVSNVDDDLFAGTLTRLGVRFDEVVTAEQVRSYKPGHAHFLEVLTRLGLDRDRVLHVAQSLHHDIAPARELDIACVWVNRRSGKKGGGATISAEVVPNLEVPDLRTFVRLVGL